MKWSSKYLTAGAAVVASSAIGVAIAGAHTNANPDERDSPIQVTINERHLSPEEARQAEANRAGLDALYASDGEILIEDDHGEVGWVSYRRQRDLDRQRLETIVRLRAANPDREFDDQALSGAYLVLDRLPVRAEQGGEIIGYLGPDGAISPEDYPRQRELAERVVLDAGGSVGLAPVSNGGGTSP